ncbi:phage tail assembly chaperone [Rhodobacteraceae bacterium W635]|uniref:rcc01693 family protein n=1 Tax=Nioella halotolerans TaxID=2303578 RepID=UPI000E3CB7B7|nr:phage tail assembly chaperone [Rhodobacteraceae bacterium W635]
MSAKARLFDWPGLMRAGMQGLGLTPAAFWALTPAELLLMLGEPTATTPLGRAGLEALAARFPDHKDDPDG